MSTNDKSQQLAEEQLIRANFLGDLPESEEERGSASTSKGRGSGRSKRS